MAKIVIVGSLMVDLTAYTPHFPVEGETVLGSNLRIGPGGKGNNQATAAARAGGNVKMIARMGKDVLGNVITEHYKNEGLSTEYITVSDSTDTGCALIEVDEQSGQNRIIVMKNANNEITKAHVHGAESEFADCDIFLTQLETSIESVSAGIHLAKKYGKTVILNPAPFQDIPDDLFSHIDYITPNETEAEFFTGIPVKTQADAQKAADALIKKGVKNVVITLGKLGAFYTNGTTSLLVAPPTVKAVDTTGAGDAFNGGLAVALAEGADIESALKFANATAAISVTNKGAATAAPKRKETEMLVTEFYK
ncbi:MAG: ribokinase [Ruminococcaceae bacterium]|nr:ribokinase [Oscillospiraceae bacterium]